jgi:hypothetical protein
VSGGGYRTAAGGPSRMARAVWILMVVVWLGALAYGVFWVWSLLASAAPTSELLMTCAWLILGIVAWIVALNMGRQRYWGR